MSKSKSKFKIVYSEVFQFWSVPEERLDDPVWELLEEQVDAMEKCLFTPPGVALSTQLCPLPAKTATVREFISAGSWVVVSPSNLKDKRCFWKKVKKTGNFSSVELPAPTPPAVGAHLPMLYAEFMLTVPVPPPLLGMSVANAIAHPSLPEAVVSELRRYGWEAMQLTIDVVPSSAKVKARLVADLDDGFIFCHPVDVNDKRCIWKKATRTQEPALPLRPSSSSQPVKPSSMESTEVLPSSSSSIQVKPSSTEVLLQLPLTSTTEDPLLPPSSSEVEPQMPPTEPVNKLELPLPLQVKEPERLSLQQELDELRRDYDGKIMELQKEKQKSDDKFKELEREIRKLHRQNKLHRQQTEQKFGEYKKKNKRLNQEIQRLNQEIDKGKQVIQELEKVIKELEKNLEVVKSTNENLEADNISLQERVDKLQVQLNAVTTQNAALTDIRAYLPVMRASYLIYVRKLLEEFRKRATRVLEANNHDVQWDRIHPKNPNPGWWSSQVRDHTERLAEQLNVSSQALSITGFGMEAVQAQAAQVAHEFTEPQSFYAHVVCTSPRHRQELKAIFKWLFGTEAEEDYVQQRVCCMCPLHCLQGDN